VAALRQLPWLNIAVGREQAMSTQRRSRLEVVYNILSTLYKLGPLKKTRLMQLVNLNTRSFAAYVDDYLVKLGAVEASRIGSSTVYRLTPRGIFLYRVLGILHEAGLLGEAQPTANRGSMAPPLPGSVEEEGPGFIRARLRCGEAEATVVVVEKPGAALLAGLGLGAALAPGSPRRFIVVVPEPGVEMKIVEHGTPIAVVVGAELPRGLLAAVAHGARILGCPGSPGSLEAGEP